MVNKNESHKAYFKFFYSVLRYKVFVAIILNVLVGLLDGVGLTVLFPLMQSLEGSAQTGESLGQMNHIFTFFKKLNIPLTVNVILILFLVLFTLKGIVKYLAHLYQTKLQLIFIRRMQFTFLDNLRDVSYKGYLQLDAGKIQNTLIAEVMRVSEAMKSYFKWGNSLVMLLTYVVMAYLANPQFALLISVGVSLTNLIYRRFNKKIKAASYETSRTGSDLNSYLIELVHYFKYLKSTSRLNRYIGRLHKVIDERQRINYQINKLWAISISLKEPTVIFMLVIVMMIQVNVMGGSITSIILSLLLFYRGLGFLLTLQSDWQDFIRNCGSFRLVNEVTDDMKAYKENRGEIQFTSVKSEIRLKNVSLSFGKNKILDNVSLDIPRNTTVALTGVSGSGKTTLVNITSSLIKPDEGEILIDNLSLTAYDLETYRNKIGYISQESVVFNDTIFNNITFWSEPTPENKKLFWEVVEMASLTSFIEEQTMKEDTPLGDNGILISGGQRQRISIARELFKKPEILILDEATSALDSETERVIQSNIENLHGAYTMIIIAHRLSTVKNADKIYLIEKGSIVHSGSFVDMVEHSSMFKNLVELQGL